MGCMAGQIGCIAAAEHFRRGPHVGHGLDNRRTCNLNSLNCTTPSPSRSPSGPYILRKGFPRLTCPSNSALSIHVTKMPEQPMRAKFQEGSPGSARLINLLYILQLLQAGGCLHLCRALEQSLDDCKLAVAHRKVQQRLVPPVSNQRICSLRQQKCHASMIPEPVQLAYQAGQLNATLDT